MTNTGAPLPAPGKEGGTYSFGETLGKNGLSLEREVTRTLQINVGLMCNQTCSHCHLEAGPARREMMSLTTMQQVVEFAGRGNFQQVDITGGAPELHPRLPEFIEVLSGKEKQLILRSNLSVLGQKGPPFIHHLKKHGVRIMASFPSLNASQTEALRGQGMFTAGLDALVMLNQMGYGLADSGLGLDLVVNPTGAFLAPAQAGLEKRFHTVLAQKWGIHFNRLLSFSNVPLGRFRQWLQQSGNYQAYMRKLSSAFNPAAVAGLMCRTLLSVSWDGHLYDCDFNQAAGIFKGNRKVHITAADSLPAPGDPIAVADHCFTCTAGAGFT